MNAHVRLLTECLAKAALLSSVADFREVVGDTGIYLQAPGSAQPLASLSGGRQHDRDGLAG